MKVWANEQMKAWVGLYWVCDWTHRAAVRERAQVPPWPEGGVRSVGGGTREEEDRGCSEKPLHRAGKYNVLFKKKKKRENNKTKK